MEIDHLFQSLFLPKISYDLPVYAASVPELNTVQRFLRRCHKRRFISYAIDIYDLLKKKTDWSIFKRISQGPGTGRGGGGWGFLEPWSPGFFCCGARSPIIPPPGALIVSSCGARSHESSCYGALEPRFFGLGALEPRFFRAGALEP